MPKMFFSLVSCGIPWNRRQLISRRRCRWLDQL